MRQVINPMDQKEIDYIGPTYVNRSVLKIDFNFVQTKVLPKVEVLNSSNSSKLPALAFFF